MTKKNDWGVTWRMATALILSVALLHGCSWATRQVDRLIDFGTHPLATAKQHWEVCEAASSVTDAAGASLGVEFAVAKPAECGAARRSHVAKRGSLFAGDSVEDGHGPGEVCIGGTPVDDSEDAVFYVADREECGGDRMIVSVSITKPKVLAEAHAVSSGQLVTLDGVVSGSRFFANSITRFKVRNR